MVRRGDDTCPFHDLCWEQQEERDKANKEEHAAMWKRLDEQRAEQGCAEQRQLPRWVFVSVMATAIPMLGWLSLSLFGVERRLTRNEIVSEILLANQEKFMKAIGVDPVVGTPPPEKVKTGGTP